MTNREIERELKIFRAKVNQELLNRERAGDIHNQEYLALDALEQTLTDAGLRLRSTFNSTF
jgi:hypothetical protein